MIQKKPSKIHTEYWVHAVNAVSDQTWTKRSGKWLLFVPFQKLDATWAIIAEETEAGRLGLEAKAATAKRNGLAKNSWIKVIYGL